MIMSSRALFEESSSDEEEDDKQQKPTTAAASTDLPKEDDTSDDKKKNDDDNGDVEMKDADATADDKKEADKDEETKDGDKEKDKSNSSDDSPERQKRTAIFDDDDSDDDDDDNDNQGTKAKDTTAPASKPPEKQRQSILDDDDSDDDDDDNVFDDKGEVVGSSAPAEESADANNNKAAEGLPESTSASMSMGKPSAVAKPPEKAVVLEADRPDEDISLHMTKLPNLVAIQPQAFDKDRYDPDEEEEEYNGYVHNMIRWRYKVDADGNVLRDNHGKLQRESNSRLVKWEDGSYTLHIGNESFEVDAVTTGSQGKFAGLNGYIYLSQKATFSNQDEELPGGTILEAMGQVSSRLTARPSSLQSEAHKSLTVAVRQRTIKKARIAEYVTQEDPEAAKAARIRTGEDREKTERHKKSGSYNKSRGPRGRRYGDDDDDGAYDDVNISRMKRGGDMDDDMDDYGSDSDDDVDDTFNSRSARDRKRKKQLEEEEEEEEELVFDEESDDDDVPVVKAHKKQRSQAVVDDDEE